MTKRATLKGNALIGQSGGPTSVINASLAGAAEAALSARAVKRVYGMRWGIEGFMRGEVVDLSGQTPATVKGLHQTPSSALGSCRHKVQEKDFPVILRMLQRFDIRYLFMIGGNDTMDTIHRVEAYCAARGYPLRGVGIPKTVDNDLYGTDHTPGYGSAARAVALQTLQAGLLARDMQKVDQFAVQQTVGRDAGWLAAAAALAKTTPDSAPHILLLPEVPFRRDAFLKEVKRVHQRCGYCYIVCGEGIRAKDGTPVSASQTQDRFHNVEFGAMGGTSAALRLHQMISQTFGWRGEFQVTESLVMCAADRASRTDVREAAACGRAAVRRALRGESGFMVSMVRAPGASYRIRYETAPLAEVAVRAKAMPASMIRRDGFYITESFLRYARPLAGPLPAYETLATGRHRYPPRR